MTVFARSALPGRWWWTIDHWLLLAAGMLVGFGVIMAFAAGGPVAENIGLGHFHFGQRQLLQHLPIAMAAMLGASLLSPAGVLRVSVLLLAIFAVLLVATLFGGAIKGAQRWISLGPLSLQPSEFIKPSFAVVAAWLFAAARTGVLPRGNLLSIAAFGALTGLILMQPDVGMAATITAVWICQFFLAGLSIGWAALLGVAGAGTLIASYFLLPHVASRVNRFLDPSSGDSFQVDRSLEAFRNGGLFGRGPGEGTVKEHLPDAHADFVLAVAGEEFGLVVCLMIVFLFAFIVLRGFARLLRQTDLFVLIAVSGLLVQFGLQAVINMASTLHLMPTKGMTLPFVSYGGSSLVATAICMGFLLALTRRRYQAGTLS